jgi:outer membrane protein TolC
MMLLLTRRAHRASLLMLVAAVAALAAMAAGCAVGPKYTPPHVEMPAAWQEGATPAPARVPGPSADRTTLERWWTIFEDPLLDDLIAKAIAGNVDLKIATARVRETRAARGIAESAALPQVDAEAAYARERRSDVIPPFRAAPNQIFGPARRTSSSQASTPAGS